MQSENARFERLKTSEKGHKTALLDCAPLKFEKLLPFEHKVIPCVSKPMNKLNRRLKKRAKGDGVILNCFVVIPVNYFAFGNTLHQGNDLYPIFLCMKKA